MKNYFYSNQIAMRIQELLEQNLSPEAAENIYIGDLSILPAPEQLSGYLPAVVISIDEVENKYANESLKILYTPYYFTIYYIYPYTYEGDNNAVVNGKRYAEEVANVFMEYVTLDDFKADNSKTEAGGIVVYSMLSSIKYESAENEFFNLLEIPAHIARMDFCVGFRTYSKEMRV